MAVINSTSFDGTANNALYLGGTAANGFVNTTSIASYAPLANPTFTGNVALTTLSANGSIGTNGQVLTSNGSVSYWSTPASGLTEVDWWYLTATNGATNSGYAITTTGWARRPAPFAKLGTGLTQSSGVFSFPSAGTWEIIYAARNGTNYGGPDTSKIEITTNNGAGWSVVNDGEAGSIPITGIVTIANTSTDKVQFGKAGSASTSYIIFKKLA